MKKSCCLFFCLIFALCAGACAAPGRQAVVPTETAPVPTAVIFNDSALEAKVRAAMNKNEGDITAAEVGNIDFLDLSNRYQPDMPAEVIIKDISALRHFNGLRELELGYNAVSDLTPLAQLHKLEILNLGSNNSVSDLSPLSGLENLSVLILENNRVQDVSPLAGLKNLTVLLLKGNGVSDYSPLSAIYPALKEKDFALISAGGVPDEPIVFTDPVLESTVRRVLGIQDRPVTRRDAFPVQSLDLGRSSLSDERYSSLSGLEHFVNLEELSLSGNNVTDLSPIGGLARMKSLVIAFNQIASIAPLSGMPHLEVLDAKNNQISDVTPLAELTKLWELQINSNRISDVGPLAGLVNLKVLLLADNPVADFSPLKEIYTQLDHPDFELK